MRLWRRHFLAVEAGIVAVLFGLFVWWSERMDGWRYLDHQLDGNRPAIYGTTASLTGSLLGFVLAAFAIAVASLGSRRLQLIGDRVGQLISTFTAATIVLGLATIACLVALFLDRDLASNAVPFYAVVLLLMLSTSTVARCVWALHNVVLIVGSPSKARSGRE